MNYFHTPIERMMCFSTITFDTFKNFIFYTTAKFTTSIAHRGLQRQCVWACNKSQLEGMFSNKRLSNISNDACVELLRQIYIDFSELNDTYYWITQNLDSSLWDRFAEHSEWLELISTQHKKEIHNAEQLKIFILKRVSKIHRSLLRIFRDFCNNEFTKYQNI